jgi:CubicO group peptidase (beta-lactamase class C family)
LAALLTFPLFASGPEELGGVLRALLEQGELTGAQALVGSAGKIEWEGQFGLVEPGGTGVNQETMFCIGSVSKPLASTVTLGLAAEGVLDLDAPISKVLKQFSNLSVQGLQGTVAAPSLRQLLNHYGGIFSQKREMTAEQGRLIRDFRLTLEESVDAIAREKLRSAPGTEFAYSGAGYCVVGRVAEVAAGKSFERLLQQRLAEPLGMRRTSYFPAPSDLNVASGAALGSGGKKAHPLTPHRLGKENRLELIGGSIYSTARDLAAFAGMMSQRGRHGDKTILSAESWRQMVTGLKGAGEPYALGWTVIREPGGEPTQLRHNGALFASRATLRIDLESGRHAVVLYSVTSGEPTAGQAIEKAVQAVLAGH